MSLRCTVLSNANPGEGKVIAIDHKMSFQSFLRVASDKLSIHAKKAYLEDGGEVDDISAIRDKDVLYISAGEPFKGRGKSSNQQCPLYSIAVMGPGSVGKSAMTLQYVQGVFVVDYDPTIEDAYRKNTAIDGSPVLLDILDTAGQEDYTALRSTWMRERDGFILVFSVTERSTYDDLQSFYDQLSVMHEDRIPPILIAGNKSDLESQRQVSYEEGRKLAESYKAVGYIETSARTGQNIEKAFATLVKAISSAKIKRDPPRPKPRWLCTIL